MVKKEPVLKIFSIFPSIAGEVNCYHQGHLCTFIRFSGCQLNCNYCDTRYALSATSGKEMSISEIIKEVKAIGIPKVTITGGEPLMQFDGFLELTRSLYMSNFQIVVETNGSFPCNGYGVDCWVVDYKLPSSGCMDKMTPTAFSKLRASDFVKFVIMDRTDYLEALNVKEWIQDDIGSSCQFAFSPVYGTLDPNTLIKWLMEDRIFDAIINAQLHKLLKLKEEK